MTIRPFRVSDQHDARRLIIDGLGEHFGYVDEAINTDLDDIMESYVRRGAHVIVAEEEGVIVGTGMLLDESHGVGRIVRMSVDRSHRRRGIARTILESLLSEARRRRFRSIVVATEPEWDDAVGFYRAAGFEPYGSDEVDIFLRRDLEDRTATP